MSGVGLSSSLVNVLWGLFNLVVAYLLVCRFGSFNLRIVVPERGPDPAYPHRVTSLWRVFAAGTINGYFGPCPSTDEAAARAGGPVRQPDCATWAPKALARSVNASSAGRPASIAVKWVVKEDGTPQALALRQTAKLIAPELLVAECATL